MLPTSSPLMSFGCLVLILKLFLSGCPVSRRFSSFAYSRTLPINDYILICWHIETLTLPMCKNFWIYVLQRFAEKFCFLAKPAPSQFCQVWSTAHPLHQFLQTFAIVYFNHFHFSITWHRVAIVMFHFNSHVLIYIMKSFGETHSVTILPSVIGCPPPCTVALTVITVIIFIYTNPFFVFMYSHFSLGDLGSTHEKNALILTIYAWPFKGYSVHQYIENMSKEGEIRYRRVDWPNFGFKDHSLRISQSFLKSRIQSYRAGQNRQNGQTPAWHLSLI